MAVASWLRFNDGLTNRNVQTLALAPGASGQNILYAGTAGGGIFKILDDGVVSDPVPVSRTFFVPVIVSAPGIGGAFYESELTLANRSSRDATVELTYTAAFGGGGGQARTTLEAGRQRIAPDAVAYLRQLGIPIPESGSRGGTLRVRFYGLPSPDEGAVFVRTTTAVTEGRAGVAYPGLPMSLLGGYQALYGLRQDASYRTNLALQNAGEAQDGDITLRVQVFASNSAGRIPRDSVTPGHSPWRVLSDQRHPALPRSGNIQRLRVGLVESAATLPSMPMPSCTIEPAPMPSMCHPPREVYLA